MNFGKVLKSLGICFLRLVDNSVTVGNRTQFIVKFSVPIRISIQRFIMYVHLKVSSCFGRPLPLRPPIFLRCSGRAASFSSRSHHLGSPRIVRSGMKVVVEVLLFSLWLLVDIIKVSFLDQCVYVVLGHPWVHAPICELSTSDCKQNSPPTSIAAVLHTGFRIYSVLLLGCRAEH